MTDYVYALRAKTDSLSRYKTSVSRYQWIGVGGW